MQIEVGPPINYKGLRVKILLKYKACTCLKISHKRVKIQMVNNKYLVLAKIFIIKNLGQDLSRKIGPNGSA